jgi:hypothetical protein
VTYDGAAHTATGSAIGVQNESLRGLVLSGTTHTDAGDYLADAWTFTNANYNSASGTVDDEISQASTATTVSVSNATYDTLQHGGSALVSGAGGLNQPLAVSYTGRNGTVYNSNTAPLNAGDYTASAVYPGDANHVGSSDSQAFSIARATPLIGATGTFTFDGMAHAATATATGVAGYVVPGAFDFSYLRSGTGGTPSANAPAEAGDYVVNAAFLSNDTNYNDAVGTGALTINKASSTTALTVTNATFDALPHGGSAIATGAGDLNESVTVYYVGRNGTAYALSTTAPTNAGDYTATANYPGDANHDGSSDSQNFTIAKMAPAVWASGTFVFDGAPHGATGSSAGVNGASVNGSYAFTYVLQGASGSPITTAPINAGTYVVNVIFTSADGNYSNANGVGSLSISKAGSAVAVAITDSVYDGTPRGGLAVVSGAGGLNQSVALSYAGRNGTDYAASSIAPTNVGDYNATAVYGGDANHTGSSSTRDFSITKATPVIDWTAPAAIIYGTPLSATQLNAIAKLGTAPVQGTYAYTPGAGTMLNAGANQTLSVVFMPDDTRNFTSASKSVAINVGQKPVTITADNKTKQFSDPMPEYSATAVGLVGSDTVGGTVNTSTTANTMSPAGTYVLTLTGSGFNPNYAVTLVTGTLTVTQEDATVIYTGDTLVTSASNSNATVNLAAFVQEAQDGSLGNALAGKLVKFSIF